MTSETYWHVTLFDRNDIFNTRIPNSTLTGKIRHRFHEQMLVLQVEEINGDSKMWRDANPDDLKNLGIKDENEKRMAQDIIDKVNKGLSSVPRTRYGLNRNKRN